MTTQYFSHDVNAQQDDKCVRLLQELGWKGYGLFWGLIERLNAQETGRIAYNPKGLAWSLHVSEKVLNKVLTEYDLFKFTEDGKYFWSESVLRRREMRLSKYGSKKSSEAQSDKPKRKPGRPRKNPLPEETATEAVVATVISDEQKQENETVINTIESVNVESVTTEPNVAPVQSVQEVTIQPSIIHAEPAQNDDYWYGDNIGQTNCSEQVIKLWNNIFKGTKRVYKGISLSPIAYSYLCETLREYSLQDIESAFKFARNDNFTWQLESTLKPKNIQLLLAKEEHQKEQSQNVTGQKYNSDDKSNSNWLNDHDWSQYESNWAESELIEDTRESGFNVA